jgi:hypothetical protein
LTRVRESSDAPVILGVCIVINHVGIIDCVVRIRLGQVVPMVKSVVSVVDDMKVKRRHVLVKLEEYFGLLLDRG